MASEARSIVLERIAAAQASGRQREAVSARPSDYRIDVDAHVDRFAMLIDRLIDYRAEVVDVRGASDPEAAVREAVASSLGARGITRVVIPAGLAPALRPSGVDVIVDDDLTPAELDGIEAAITSSAAAVAATGTILMDHDADQGRRAITLVPDVHVCLVRSSDVFGELPAAIRALGPRPLMTWISGPSATSDIELVRVEGVHGPRTLIVVIHD